MKKTGDLDARLENWGKAQRYSSASGSVIGSAEGRYPGDNPAPRSIEAMLLDHNDAEIVERAWKKLLPFDKNVLHLHYILRMSPPVICRRLKLPRFSNGAFLSALAHGKSEIAKVLDKMAADRRLQFERQRSYDLVTFQPRE